jgi:hypothetical protein
MPGANQFGPKPGGAVPPGGKAPQGADAAKAEPPKPKYFDEIKYDFKVQFCWKPTTLNERLLNRKKKEAAAQAPPELAEGATP